MLCIRTICARSGKVREGRLRHKHFNRLPEWNRRCEDRTRQIQHPSDQRHFLDRGYGGSNKAVEENAIRSFLGTFEILELSAEIANQAIAIRKQYRLKIPDAIVYATARTQGCMLVSRNTKDLKQEWPDIRIPYQI